MRVCFVSHTSGKGGAERALIELLEALKKRGVECRVILPRAGDLIHELQERGVPSCVIPYRWWVGKNSPLWKRASRALLNLSMTGPVAAAIARWKCDIVVTNTFNVCVGAFAAGLLGRPHVWYVHDFGYEDHGLTFDLGSRVSSWLMARLSSSWIANSCAVARKHTPCLGQSGLSVVYYSVNFKPRVSLGNLDIPLRGSRRMRCALVGALQEGKGQHEAIRAIADLVREGMQVELTIVGDGDPKYESFLHDLVDKSQLEGHVEFVGYVESPIGFMESADVVLMCSRCEAFGRVTVEAMRVGKPVIGTRRGGTVELVRDGFNGFLYDPGNHVELAGRIRYLYEHPDVAARMGDNGRRWASSQFTEDRYAEGVLAVLRQVAKRRCSVAGYSTR